MPNLNNNVFVMMRGKRTGRGRLFRFDKCHAKSQGKLQAKHRTHNVRAVASHAAESLEHRMMLTADPIQFGAVYTEQDSGSDNTPDTIEISFVGGAENTQLTQVIIDGDKILSGLGPGLGFGDMIFDTESTGLGIDLPFPESFAQKVGEFDATISVEDGSSLLTIDLNGFDAGEILLLSVDVDEVQGFDPDETDLVLINEELDPIASGAEFQGSQLTAHFTSPHFHDVSGTAEFRNRYDENLDATELTLPRDDEGENRDRTAGAVGEVQQEPLPISISGTVYEDENANLNQEAGDLGLANVELRLYVEQDGQFVFTGHTTLTDENGEYRFDESLDLSPGTYQIQETQPENFFSVGAEVGLVDGVATGSVQDADVLTAINISNGGTRATEYNFAEARPASIQGRVHLSSPDGDCWDDSVVHEPVAGVTIQLLDANDELIAETRTDADGRYEFLNLRPGQYSLIEITPESLISGGSRAGTVDGETEGSADENTIQEISLSSGDEGVEFEFCEHEPAELRGSVYHDRDNDGLREVGEEGIANVILSLLDEVGEIVDSVETDADGRYEFVGVRAGNYRVIEMHPSGWLDGRDRAGTANGRSTGRAINPGDEIEAISLLWGDRGVDYDFGEIMPASIGGTVHLSTPDGDCWDVDESLLEPVAGAVVQLFDATGQVLAETVTDENGDYFFDDLVPGEYSIRQITPDGLVDGGSQAGNIDGETRGQVDALGDIQSIRLNSGEAGTDFDFCEHKPATISGFVYEDANNDGVRDPGEVPIEGVIIQLFDEDGNLIAETTTDANGMYAFEGLEPGNYSLRQIQPEDYIDGIDTAGTVDGERRGEALNPGDEIVSIDLGWGETGEEFNFAELLPASISGFVHSSVTDDCWNDPNAEPLSGVRITLLDEAGDIVAETLTDADGQYSFGDLAPSNYSLVQEQPDTHFDGQHRAEGGGDTSQPNLVTNIDLSSGALATGYDFCELPPSQISGFVFVDGAPIELETDEVLPIDISPIRDGQLTTDDELLDSVTVELRDGISGLPLDGSIALSGTYPSGPIRTFTNEDGYYEFANLPAGSYSVFEVQPEDYVDGIDTPGTANGIAINPIPPSEDDIELETVIASLETPHQNDAIVRIGLFPGTHSQLNNFSEVTTLTLPPLDAIPPLDPPEPRTPPPAISPEPISLYQFSRELPPLVALDDPLLFESSESTVQRTWHLSIVDGGQPRVAEEVPATTNFLFPTAAWRANQLSAAKWAVQTKNGNEVTHYFGTEGAIPITGDFNGDGTSEIGVYAEGHWFIDLNGDGRWDSKDLWAKLGNEGDLPVTGDWDGDGKDDIGIFGRRWQGDQVAVAHEHGLPDMDNVPDGSRKNMPPKLDEATAGQRVMKLTARGRLRADLIDHVFIYGAAGDMAIAGDWNGDGIDTVGVYRAGVWRLDMDGNGRWTEKDESLRFGRPGDFPLVGDFNGDGIDDMAIVRNGKIYFDSNGNRILDVNDLVMEFDESKGLPIVGMWSDDGADQIGFFKPIDEERVLVASRPETK